MPRASTTPRRDARPAPAGRSGTPTSRARPARRRGRSRSSGGRAPIPRPIERAEPRHPLLDARRDRRPDQADDGRGRAPRRPPAPQRAGAPAPTAARRSRRAARDGAPTRTTRPRAGGRGDGGISDHVDCVTRDPCVPEPPRRLPDVSVRRAYRACTERLPARRRSPARPGPAAPPSAPPTTPGSRPSTTRTHSRAAPCTATAP